MSLTINTNVASLQAQNNLSQVNKALEQNQERLSSGLRINSAADDAAGLAITDRMTAQVKGMNQAARNANDGISLFQTAEGGMEEMTDLLQRMREIAVQSANETNTPQDRESLDQEFQDLKAELNRIAESTTFNGQNILDGTRGEADFQVGADTGEVNQIVVDMGTSMQSSDIGARAEGTMDVADIGTEDDLGGFQLEDGDLEVNGVALDNLSDFAQAQIGDDTEHMGETQSSAFAIAQAINAKNDEGAFDTNITAVAEGVEQTIDTEDGVTVDGTDTGYLLEINNVEIYGDDGGTTDLGEEGDIDISTLVAQINQESENTGVTAEETDEGLKLMSEDGRDIVVNEEAGGDVTGIFEEEGGDNTAAYRGQVNVTSEDTVNWENTGDNAGSVFEEGATDTYNPEYLESSDIREVEDARAAIEHIDSAINDVDSFRATMGAAQNRMDSTIANLENASQNLTEARSRIEDADIAKESSEQTMNNVRRQASAAVLTQANQSPQLALQLLGG